MTLLLRIIDNMTANPIFRDGYIDLTLPQAITALRDLATGVDEADAYMAAGYRVVQVVYDEDRTLEVPLQADSFAARAIAANV